MFSIFTTVPTTITHAMHIKEYVIISFTNFKSHINYIKLTHPLIFTLLWKMRIFDSEISNNGLWHTSKSCISPVNVETYLPRGLFFNIILLSRPQKNIISFRFTFHLSTSRCTRPNKSTQNIKGQSWIYDTWICKIQAEWCS